MVSKRLKHFEELSPKVSYWYAQMHKVRERLLNIIGNLSETLLDFTPDEKMVETTGTLLIHIAGVEWSWIFEDIDGLKMDFERFKYGFALRPEMNLPQIKGKGKQFYITLLEEVREEIYQRMKKMSDDDLQKEIQLSSESYTIEWILFHILEHETMHIGQIQLLNRL